jgi:hypothetical protein
VGKHSSHLFLYVVRLLLRPRSALPQLRDHFIVSQPHSHDFLFFFLQSKLQFRSGSTATLQFVCSLNGLELL